MDKLLIKELVVKVLDGKDKYQTSYSDYLKKVVTVEELCLKVLDEIES